MSFCFQENDLGKRCWCNSNDYKYKRMWTSKSFFYTKSYDKNYVLQIKCDVYWPLEGTEIYGSIQVTLVKTLSLAYYTKRVFSIRCKTSQKVFSVSK